MRKIDLLRGLFLLLILLPACGAAGGGEAPSASMLRLVAVPTSLAFRAIEGGSAPEPLHVIVVHEGSGTSTWQAASSVAWATLKPTEGGPGDRVDVAVDPTGLTAGTHEGAITLRDPNAANSPLTVSVTLVVTAPPPVACGHAPLPPPTGVTVEVSTAAELSQAIVDANRLGGARTLLLADGTYPIAQLLHVTAPDIAVRGASGERDAVIVRGDGMTGSVAHGFLVSAPRFTLADLTVGWVRHHGVQIQGEHDADDVLVHNVRFTDTGEQMLKVSYDETTGVSADRGIVRFSHFEYDAGVGPQYYIGGVDCHRGVGWVVHHNVFRAIRSPESRLAEHAIHFWNGARDTIVASNVIVDCDRGIGFGLGASSHVGGLIRNNMVQTTRDVGIGLESAPGTTVVHNSVYAASYPNAIEYRFSATTDVTVVQNVTVGAITARDGATGSVTMNHEASSADEVFVDANAGDLHLRAALPEIVDRGERRPDVAVDLDCDARPQGPAPDLGADEWRTP